MDPTDDEHLASILVFMLEGVPALRERLQNVIVHGPAPTSAAVLEQAVDFGELPWVLAGLRCTMGMDSLLTWHALRLQLRLQPQAAHLTLCRAALEAAVTARWVVDPSATGDQRRRRALWLQQDDFTWKSKFERRAMPAARRSKQGAQLRARASALGVMPIAMDMTQRMEQFTEISVKEQIGGGAMYGLLSSFAHAQEWSVLAAERSQQQPTPGVQAAHTAIATTDAVLTTVATMLAVDTMRAAISELATYSA
jgi:hypothetical protein